VTCEAVHKKYQVNFHFVKEHTSTTKLAWEGIEAQTGVYLDYLFDTSCIATDKRHHLSARRGEQVMLCVASVGVVRGMLRRDGTCVLTAPAPANVRLFLSA